MFVLGTSYMFINSPPRLVSKQGPMTCGDEVRIKLLKWTCRACGTNPSTLERNGVRAHQFEHGITYLARTNRLIQRWVRPSLRQRWDVGTCGDEVREELLEQQHPVDRLEVRFGVQLIGFRN